jgi:hypothetical protein
MLYVDKFQCCLEAQLFGSRLVLSEVWRKGYGHGSEICENRVLTPHSSKVGTSLPVPGAQPRVEVPTSADAELARLREEVIGKLKESRASAERLLALHEDEKNKLTTEYQRLREFYTKGLIRRAELDEVKRALAEATVRVEEDKRWIAEADLAIKEVLTRDDPRPQPTKLP